MSLGKCVLYKGSKDRRGYGRLLMNNNYMAAHRVSWVFHRGKVPPDKCVLHKCNNPPCINPKHLYLGTAIQNAMDRSLAFRAAKGIKHGQAKLDWKKVRAIRSWAKRGIPHAKIATLYGVSANLIWLIARNKLWKI